MQTLEQRAISAESAASTARDELETLKSSISTPSADTAASTSEDPTTLQNKITLLESDLRTAHSTADSAVTRATALEQKIEALTKLHRESSTLSSTREKEIRDLKTRLSSKSNSIQSPNLDGLEELSDLEDEEREKLHARIRDLEAENFDLRRGVWRDKRTALQPGIEGEDGGDATSAIYEDVDLNGNGGPYGGGGGASATSRMGMAARGSSFQDVLASGISAFTGRDRRRSNDAQQHPLMAGGGGHGRKQSLGLLSEEGFDEDAFAKAQEDEGRRRLERIREVKRGLENWRGWRVDLVDLRGGGLGGGAVTGPVFEV